jgi:hypothetical protein
VNIDYKVPISTSNSTNFKLRCSSEREDVYLLGISMGICHIFINHKI